MIEYKDGVATIDGYKFRKDKATGYYLSSRRIGNRRKRLHVYVWEKANGSVPNGYDIHHKDGDKDNNEIGNLQLLTRSEHQAHHAANITEEEKKRRAERIIGLQDKAKAWHKSEEGKAWHKQHAKEVAENRKPIEYRCTQCGATFESKKVYKHDSNKFCSGKCRAAHRRQSKKDNEIRICKGCGNEFETNKYSKARFCKSCHRGKRWLRVGLQYASEG